MFPVICCADKLRQASIVKISTFRTTIILFSTLPKDLEQKAGATPTGRLTLRRAPLTVIHGPKNLSHQRLRDLENPGGDTSSSTPPSFRGRNRAAEFRGE